jgi:hypothetical protein
MSLTTVLDVRALVETAIGDDDLQDVIDREEARLARRIGPLTGERTVVIPRPPYNQPIRLYRAATAATVEDNGTEVDVTVHGGYIYRGADTYTPLTYWVGPVSLTYTPDDELEVRAGVIEMVRAALTASPYQSESIDGYSYTRASGGFSLAALVRSLTFGGTSTPYTLTLAARP